MNNIKILKMLENGQIENLKAVIKQEIYTDSLKRKSGARERYKAMLRFVKYNADNIRAKIRLPKEIDGKLYFTNGNCLVETSEEVGDIETSSEEFLDVEPIFNDVENKNKYSYHSKLNVQDIVARAKSEGYKFTAKALNDLNMVDKPVICKIHNSYYNLALLEYAYSIIADGETAIAIYSDNWRYGIFFETSVGRAYVLPIRYEKPYKDNEVIIEVKLPKPAEVVA